MTGVVSWRSWLVAAPVGVFVVTAVVISGGGGPVVRVPSVVEVGAGTGTSPAVPSRPASPAGRHGTPTARPLASPAPPAAVVVVVPTRPVVVVDDNGEPSSDSSVPATPSGGGDG